ncbi:hypothetical protein FACS189430_12080 [Bacteroidia bacterium]|nr:hypothetical protein FACS189430_12080 [Bacteroidia bacterium]
MLFSSCSHTKQNKATGDIIIKKIELYKKANGVLPNSLQDIGQDEIINNVLFCYDKVDSVNYVVWFGTTLGEGIYYYSDTQQWENRLRKMKD